MRLDGTTIVVTGAVKGLGRVMTEAFLDAGANVVLGDLPDAGLDEAVADLQSRSGTAVGTPADVRSWDQVEALVGTAVERFGGLDVLVNNAGVRQLGFGPERPVKDVPLELWRTVIETNLTGSFHGAKAALPHLLERGSGRIVFISTGHWPEASANCGPYVASKFGIEGLARALAQELRGTDLQSIVLEPGGAVDTDLVAHLDEAARRERMDPSVIAEPAVWLAAGNGDNGGRYVATELEVAD